MAHRPADSLPRGPPVGRCSLGFVASNLELVVRVSRDGLAIEGTARSLETNHGHTVTASVEEVVRFARDHRFPSHARPATPHDGDFGPSTLARSFIVVCTDFLVRDDEEQHRRAVGLLRRGAEQGETFFVGDVVLAEVTWMLRSRYHCTRDEIAGVIRQLTEVQEVTFESTERVVRALRAFQEGRGGFADYLIAERARDAGCASVATFDRALHADDGFLAP